MPKSYREDILTLSTQYPFGVVLRLLDRAVILILARWSQSNYHDVRIVDESTIHKTLSTFRADFTAINGIRRLLADGTSLAHNPNLLTGDQVIEAATAAVVVGNIYAVIAETSATSRAHSSINYNRLAALYLSSNPEIRKADFFAFLYQQLPRLCCDAYAPTLGASDQIVQLNDSGYEFLFDLSAERVVAAFGATRYNPGKRDSARMAGFLGQGASKPPLAARDYLDKASLTWRDRFFQTYGHKYDRGHFISHRQGGGLDINLFPQRTDINQGRTPLGAEYRAMETACVARPGVDPVFCCSRPLYDDDSWVPAELEYAVFYSPQRIASRTFPNK